MFKNVKYYSTILKKNKFVHFHLNIKELKCENYSSKN